MRKATVRNPRYNMHGTITVDLWDFERKEFFPFTADPEDPEEHGRDLHAELIAGKHGEIKPYVAPVPTREQVENMRLRAYSNPYTGSDRMFAEAQRLQLTGDPSWQAKVAEANARYEAIKAEYPFP